MTGIFKLLLAVTGAALILAIGDWPYDFYVMLKGLVSVSAVLLAAMAIRSKQYGWLFLAAPAFVLWFPLIGIEMTRQAWLPLNLAVGIGFLAAWKSISFDSEEEQVE